MQMTLAVDPGTAVRSPLHVVAYTDVVLHMLCTGCPRKSTLAHSLTHRNVHRKGAQTACTARSAATRTPASSTPVPPTTARRTPPPAVHPVRPQVHDRRDREPHRGQALRRHRAVQPGQGAQRASARPARAARSPRTTWRVLAQRVEEGVRATGAAEIDAHEVGLAVLGPLRELDEVAYLRFASVYRCYDSLEDFEAEIALLPRRSTTSRLAQRRAKSPEQHDLQLRTAPENQQHTNCRHPPSRLPTSRKHAAPRRR